LTPRSRNEPHVEIGGAAFHSAYEEVLARTRALPLPAVALLLEFLDQALYFWEQGNRAAAWIYLRQASVNAAACEKLANSGRFADQPPA
jgi:hypothetical protein